MENLFLDANVICDIFARDKYHLLKKFANDKIYISALSLHILCYAGKIVMPDEEMLRKFDKMNIVDLSSQIAERAFLGPTKDYEDNIQLHSCAICLADIFYTSDKGLLKLGYFGSTQIKALEG